MSTIIVDVVKGALKVQNLPEQFCFRTFREFVEAIPQLISVEVPASITNIVIGSTEPTEDQRDSLWARRDVNGNFLGLYIFNKGTWRLAYNFAPGEIIWIAGDSRVVPDGFQIVDENNSAVTTPVAMFLKGQYLLDPTATFYVYYAVTYTNF